MEREENNQEITTERSITDNKEQKSQSFVNKLFIGILVVLLIILGGGLGWWYMKQSQPKVSQSTSSAKKKDIAQLTIVSIDKGWNTFFPDSDDTSELHFSLSNQISEGLVGYDNLTDISPRLAESWTNPNQTTWRFNLKKGVKFHTGRIMTAEDVVYSFEKAQSLESYDLYTSTIASVTEVNPYVVEIKTKKPDAILLNKIGLIRIIDANGKAPNNTLTAGTGPYVFKPGTTPRDDRIELVAFDKYHGGRPTTRALTIYAVDTQEQAMKDLHDKKANLAGELPDKVSELQKSDYPIEVPNIGSSFLTINSNKSGPLQKKDVRKAVRYALDVDAIIKESGTNAVAASQLVTKVIPGYNPDVKVVTQDVERSKSLLTQAGYPNGFPLTFVYSQSGNEKIAALIKEQLGSVGIIVKLVPLPSNDITELLEKIDSGEADIAILAYNSDTYDAQDVYEGVFKQTINFKSPQLDEYLQQVTDTFDGKKRLDTLKNITSLANEETIVIPLYVRSNTWVAENNSYVFPRDIANQRMGVYYWKAYMKP